MIHFMVWGKKQYRSSIAFFSPTPGPIPPAPIKQQGKRILHSNCCLSSLFLIIVNLPSNQQ